MPSGQRDWANIKTVENLFTLGELGEVAARLNSVDFYDRRGQTIWFDDFSSGINSWIILTQGVNSSVTISNESSRHGSFSCKLLAGSGAGDSALMQHLVGLFSPTRIGFAFNVDVVENLNILDSIINVYVNSVWLSAVIRYDRTNSKIQYKDVNGVYQTLLSSFRFPENPIGFNSVKFVIDVPNKKYVRAMINGYEILFSATIANVPTGISTNYLGVVLLAYNVTGNTSKIYIDDVVITVNEP